MNEALVIGGVRKKRQVESASLPLMTEPGKRSGDRMDPPMVTSHGKIDKIDKFNFNFDESWQGRGYLGRDPKHQRDVSLDPRYQQVQTNLFSSVEYSDTTR